MNVWRAVLPYWRMSKAFTRESDRPEADVRPRPASRLPPGTKNYLTARGAEELRRELDQLRAARSRLASGPDADDVAAELQRLADQIADVQQALAAAVVVEPPALPDDVVRFGATVTVREPDGSGATYRIVGVNETDLDRNWISWLSPLAKSLLQARAGQRVRCKFPSGEEELEILRVSYD